MANLHEILKELGIEHKQIGLPGTAYYNEKEDNWYYVEENSDGNYSIKLMTIDGEEPSKVILT